MRARHQSSLGVIFAAAALLPGCFLAAPFEGAGDAGAPGVDSGPRADAGSGEDDAGPIQLPDAGLEIDGGPRADAGDLVDASLDAGPSVDASLDAGPSVDSGLDAGMPDAGLDAGMSDAGCSFAPFCDVDDHITCTAGATARTPCPFGCDATMGCATILPSNVGTAVDLEAGAGAFVFGAGETYFVRSDDGRILRDDFFDEEIRPGSPGLSEGVFFATLPSVSPDVPAIGVLVFESLTVQATARVEIRGERAMVFLVERDAIIDGVIDAGGDIRTAGPGGGRGGSTTPFQMNAPEGMGAGDNGVDGNNNDSGGGGGAYLSAGSPGGDSTSGLFGGAGGAVYTSAPSLVPLLGGSGGGAGGDDESGQGGGGGGAFQLSVGGTFTVSGVITSGGGGGQGGRIEFADSDSGAGGGGGSGGALLLEGSVVDLSGGAVAVNGGAGGAGWRGCGAFCITTRNGEQGGVSPPATTSGTDGSGGGGGEGSDRDAMSSPGLVAQNGGGGGGGAGRIRVNTRAGSGALGAGEVTPTAPAHRSEGVVQVHYP